MLSQVCLHQFAQTLEMSLVKQLLYLYLLVCSLSISIVNAKPAGGVAKFPSIVLEPAPTNSPPMPRMTGVCKEIGLYGGSAVEVGGFYKATGAKGVDNPSVPFHIEVKLYKARCANTIGDEFPEMGCTDELKTSRMGVELVDSYASPPMMAESENHRWFLTKNWTHSSRPTIATTTVSAPTVSHDATTSSPSPQPENNKPESNDDKDVHVVQTRKRSVTIRADTNKTKMGLSMNPTTYAVQVQNGSSMYIVQVLFIHDLSLQNPKEKGSLNISMTLKMRNPHGYLSAVDYPALVFYGVMTAVYTIYAFAWILMMACSYKDLVRLQFWVLAVILLGFLEKMLFVSEYGSINTGHDPSGLILIAELVSAVKRALSRMLLIIVAMGFGTVKPRLGDSLGKVVAVGVVYTILAVMDGIIRARNETFVSRDTASTVTLALLLIFDTLVIYWIFTAIVDTRRTLRLRKNYVKLAMYNHFAYTLVFAIVASLGFVVWALVTLNFPAGNCLTDWREVWLRECFWHVLFAFILLIVMIIWRPSANRNRFAYSLVNEDEDVEEEEPEQGPNKNFDTLKMRQMTKSESEALPPVSSQAEDDLRWVEENLPTTAMDRALPLILDSDEEVMTTKFEISKMN